MQFLNSNFHGRCQLCPYIFEDLITENIDVPNTTYLGQFVMLQMFPVRTIMPFYCAF